MLIRKIKLNFSDILLSTTFHRHNFFFPKVMILTICIYIFSLTKIATELTIVGYSTISILQKQKTFNILV